jgi:hypothetical protein
MSSPEEATMRSKVDIHARGIEVTTQLAGLIDEQLKGALAGMERRVVGVHIRLYGEPAGCTCYIRIDLAPSGGFARGDSGDHPRQAVERASERIRAVAMAYVANGAGALRLGGDS